MRTIFKREGVPFNSSSSHTIIRIKGEVPENLTNISPESYGWEDFRLTDVKAKQHYILAQLIWYFITIYAEVVKEMYEKEKTLKWTDYFKAWMEECKFDSIIQCEDYDNLKIEDYEVDHNSQWHFPYILEDSTKRFLWDSYYEVKDKKEVFNKYAGDAAEFLCNVFKEILAPSVVIYGGNDNCEEANEIMVGRIDFDHSCAFSFLRTSYAYNVRKADDVWVLHRSDNGIIVFNFKDNKEEVEDMPYLSIPYLMDIQVSDKCSRGCDFCYRHCTPDAPELEEIDICRAIEFLSEAGVENLVLGGGNLTELRKFPYIAQNVSYLQQRYADVNKFSLSTTIHMHDFIKHVCTGDIDIFVDNFAGIGISVPSDYDAMELKTMLKKLCSMLSLSTSNRMTTFVLQIIPELFSVPQLQQLFAIVAKTHFNIRINFLGYKKGVVEDTPYLTPEQYDCVLKEMKNSYSCMCDAAFVEKYKDKLQEDIKIEKCRLLEQDGRGTCFFDAINKRLYMSSTSKDYVDFDIKEARDKKLTPREYLSLKRKELYEKVTYNNEKVTDHKQI